MSSETEPVLVDSSTCASSLKSVRLHIGGLPAHIKEADLIDRFTTFGIVTNVEVIPHQFLVNACRGFAYLSLETDDSGLKRCINTLNNAAWKGGKLRISSAKPSFHEKQLLLAPEVSPLPQKQRRPLIRLAGNQSLVTDKNVDTRRGWRRGRYGRAIAMLKIRKPSGELITIDPTHYKDNLEKLFGSVRPRPLEQLAWSISDFDDENRDKRTSRWTNSWRASVLETPVVTASIGAPLREEKPTMTETASIQSAFTENTPETIEVVALNPLLEGALSSMENYPSDLAEDQNDATEEETFDSFKVNVSWKSLLGNPEKAQAKSPSFSFASSIPKKSGSPILKGLLKS